MFPQKIVEKEVLIQEYSWFATEKYQLTDNLMGSLRKKEGKLMVKDKIKDKYLLQFSSKTLYKAIKKIQSLSGEKNLVHFIVN